VFAIRSGKGKPSFFYLLRICSISADFLIPLGGKMPAGTAIEASEIPEISFSSIRIYSVTPSILMLQDPKRLGLRASLVLNSLTYISSSISRVTVDSKVLAVIYGDFFKL
jgi:hypothetical protein